MKFTNFLKLSYIAFPKNNSGRDVMIHAPSKISDEQLEELSLRVEINS